MSLPPLRGVTVNRLRIHARMDPLTARLRTGWLLDESAMQPSGLPPSAILCIRRLKDPQPGAIALDRMQLPPRNWTDRVSASIAALARRAERPARGDVPDDAEAVMFADRAELLACLAADWCAGRLGSRWWSRELLKNLADGPAILRAWVDARDYVASALEILDARDAAASFVERLSRSDTRALLDGIIVHHGLREVAAAIEPLTHDGSGIETDDSARDNKREPTRSPDALDTPARAPWIEYVPDGIPARLSPEQKCLLGIALTIRRAPAAVRALEFAEQLRRWSTRARAEPTRGEVAPHESVEVLDRNERDGVDAAAGVETNDRPRDVSKSRASKSDSLHLPKVRNHHVDARNDRPRLTASSEIAAPGEMKAESLERATRSRDRIHGDPGTATVVVDGQGHADAAGSPASQALAGRPIASADDTNHTVDRPRESNAARSAERLCSRSIATQLGGVFYLVNLATSLGLYGDFTRPMHRGLEVPFWDFLAFAARRLIPRPRFQDDALWILLDDLAGPPRGDNKAPIDDLRRRAAPSVRCLASSIPARLARATPRIDRHRAAALLCLSAATVLTSATHIDVMFALADLPIAVRLTGLDRNPGWVPAADRVIAFHYD
jgi:hypothetical protein